MPQTFPALNEAPGFHHIHKNRVKGPTFPALRAGTLQMVQKGPKLPGATCRETHHQISPHIFNMYLQPFFPTWVGEGGGGRGRERGDLSRG